MHYVPESAREFLQDDTSSVGTVPSEEVGFHYRSAPIYLLTAIVGLLLGVSKFAHVAVSEHQDRGLEPVNVLDEEDMGIPNLCRFK